MSAFGWLNIFGGMPPFRALLTSASDVSDSIGMGIRRKETVRYPVEMADNMDHDWEIMKFARFMHGGETTDPLYVSASLFNAAFRSLGRLADQDGERLRLMQHVYEASYAHLAAGATMPQMLPPFHARAPVVPAAQHFNRDFKR